MKGFGVVLNMALMNYGLSFLRRRGYTEVQPPYFMRKEIMSETAELSDFNETLYKVRGPLRSNVDCGNHTDALYSYETRSVDM